MPPVATVGSVSPYNWHCYLGHPSISNLKKVLSFSEPIFKINCDACLLGKHHKTSFPSKESQSLYPFDLVHLDIYDPCHYSTLLGHQYFITFVAE